MDKKFYIIPAMMLTLAASAGAYQFKVSNGPETDGTLRLREPAQRTFTMKKVAARTPMAKTIGVGGADISEVEKLGTLRLVFEEDFNKMVNGSIEEPDTKTNMLYKYWVDEEKGEVPECEYPWWNLKHEYTNEPHWGGGSESPSLCGQAGGCYYMWIEEPENPMKAPGQAHINTPLIKVDEDGAICVLEFKARTKNEGETYDWLLVEAAETNNMGPTWNDVDESVLVNQIPAEWTTYRFVFREGGPTTMFNIVAVGPGNVYIDDLKVYQMTPNVMYPTLKKHSDYEGTSFVANWEPVEGADSYLISVYSLDENGDKVEFLNKQAVNGTSYKVTGTESGEAYYYVVNAVKGTDVSLDSYPMRVYALVAPEMKDAVIKNGWTYTAKWGDVPGADVYNYMAYAKRVAEEDGVFVVTDEDFTGLTDLEGNKTGLTKEDPEPYTYQDKFYPLQMKQQGWYGESAMPYDDYMAIDAFHYEVGNGQSAFVSPELDLSKDGGKFTLEVDLAAATDDMGNTTSCIVGVFHWSDAKGDYEQIELYPLEEPLSLNWKRCTFTSDKGNERTSIGIFAVRSFDNLYIDNIKITQNYKKGDYLMDPFKYVRWHGRYEDEIPSEIDVELPYFVQDMEAEIHHKVSAFSRVANQQLQIYDDRESPFSELKYVMISEPSGVESIEAAPVEGEAEYFTVDGVRVNSADLTPGLYIVRRGSTATKEIVK